MSIIDRSLTDEISNKLLSSESLFLLLPMEIHLEILSYLPTIYQVLVKTLEKNAKRKNREEGTLLSFRLIHPNYTKLISKYLDKYCWFLIENVFDDYYISDQVVESLQIKEKFTRFGLVKCLGSFLQAIRKIKENEGKIFRRNSSPLTIETLVDGRGGSGKTSIISRYLFGQDISEYDPTIYDTFRQLILVDNIEDMANFRDCCGQEEFDPYKWWNYDDFDIVILVCSMIDVKSLENLDCLLTELVKRKGRNVSCVIAMNKCDLPEYYEITLEMVNEIVEKFELTNCTIMKTSAKTGENIKELIEFSVRKYRERIGDPISVLEQVLQMLTRSQKKKGTCIIE